MDFAVTEKEFSSENNIQFGNKFLIGNGYMGFRGTLEEFKKEDLVACNLLGIYDRQGDLWREPINAQNGLYTTVLNNGKEISTLTAEPEDHTQTIDIRNGLHKRETVYDSFSIRAERFASMDNIHLLVMKYTVIAHKTGKLTVRTGIDSDVWDINGPHFSSVTPAAGEISTVTSVTGELGLKVAVAETVKLDFECDESLKVENNSIFRELTFEAEPGREYNIFKTVAVFTENDGVEDVTASAKAAVKQASEAGYDILKKAHTDIWDKLWDASDVVVEGDDEAQIALRYSIYHLLIIAPRHSDKVSIPARGLSGQTYKGAIFWDTEMFMLPFFLHTDPDTARNLIKYRVATLDGARAKAKEYGFRGAFYAWESQERGNDACSDYNITDVFTKRPMRTFFRDKQVHISADVAYAIWETYEFTGDDSVLLDGGAEVILECARFFYSYAYYKYDKDRFEILDVIGPDEYHERVNNNAYTSKMVAHTFEIAVKTCELLKSKYKDEYDRLIKKLDYEGELEGINLCAEKLYVPEPDEQTGLIEQFDGYFKLEDCSVDDVRSRLLDDKEYWGGAYGVASQTQVIKQADVVLMLNLFKNEYSTEIKAKNWEYYEPRTEHGSSLSPCIYSLLACECGNQEWGYPYFMKTASVDLTGKTKQFAGLIYIGGTHPAANGGAWMAAVLGFAGLNVDNGEVKVNPRLPKKWNRLKFNIIVRGEKYAIDITKDGAKICKR